VVPWLVLAAALALAAAGAIALENSRLANAHSRFLRRSELVVAALHARISDHEELLRACAAHVASSPAAEAGRWPSFVAALQLGERYPAIDSLGVVGGKAAESLPDVRRSAIAAARRSGAASVSAKLELPGDGQVPETGIAMYLPVPRDPGTLEPTGGIDTDSFVAADIRVHDLLRGILDPRTLQVLDMRIYDAAGADPAAVLVDTSSEALQRPLFGRRVAFPMPGRPWTIEFLSRPEFDDAFRSERPWGLFAASLAACFLGFALARALVASLERAHQLSMRDPLTGLFNRRYVDETMEREIARARRAGASVGVIVLDIDHFKQLNDTYGHDAGDHVLARTGELLRHVARTEDIACRFGGEEFALILPGASLEVARDRAEAIRALFEATPFVFDGARIGPLTLTAGVCALEPGDDDWMRVLQLADRALYTGKQAGRNRVLAVAPE